MNTSHPNYEEMKGMLLIEAQRYFACTTSDMREILFIMKYHSVLPAVTENITA